MLKANRVAIAAIVAGTVSLLSTMQPASAANDFVNMFKEILTRQVQPQAGDQVSQRENEISRKIIEAINSNRLTLDQTQQLKSQFDNIKNLENTYRNSDGTLDSIETASLNTEFNRLDNSLNRMLGTPGSTTATTTTTTNISGVADNTEPKLRELYKRITDNLDNGRLTPEEATNMKTDFDRVIGERNNRMADGVFSPQDAAQVDGMIEELRRRIASNTHDNQVWPGINGLQAVQAQRLSSGLSSGQLTQREFGDLKNESDRIAQREAHARANGLQFGETLQLAADLKALQTRIDQKMTNAVVTNPGGGNWGHHDGGGDNPGGGNWGHHDGGGDNPGGGNWGHHDGGGDNPGGGNWNHHDGGVPTGGAFTWDNHKGDIMRRVDRGVMTGRLTNTEADDMRADFGRLEQLQSHYTMGGRMPNPNEVAVLDRGLNNIMTELSDRLHDDNGASVNVGLRAIDRKQADLKHKLDDGMNSGRLSATEAAKFRANLEWVDSVEVSLRRSGGILDPAEEAQLNADLDRISAKMDRAMTNGNSGVVSLEARKTDLNHRIDEGVANRRLSTFEAQMLRNEFQRINWMQQRLTRDGRLDPQDMMRISSELDKVNTTLTRELQDRRVVGSDYGGKWHGGDHGGSNAGYHDDQHTYQH